MFEMWVSKNLYILFWHANIYKTEEKHMLSCYDVWEANVNDCFSYQGIPVDWLCLCMLRFHQSSKEREKLPLSNGYRLKTNISLRRKCFIGQKPNWKFILKEKTSTSFSRQMEKTLSFLCKMGQICQKKYLIWAFNWYLHLLKLKWVMCPKKIKLFLNGIFKSLHQMNEGV